MSGCYLSIDLEDFSHDLQYALGVENPSTSGDALRLAVKRILEVVKTIPGQNELTFFATGQVARDHGEIIRDLAISGHEIGCHSFYHDNVHELGLEGFEKYLDDAIQVISHASGNPVYGFRAPNFSILPDDDWAYNALAKRFMYDSSWVTETRDNPNSSTDIKIYDKNKLIEFPIFSNKLLPGFNVRVIGGTYLKILPLSVILKLMHRAVEEGFLPLIYLHPHEFLSDGEFWVKAQDLPGISMSTKIYWQIRQNQWLRFGNQNVIQKLVKILEVFPHQGTMHSHLL